MDETELSDEDAKNILLGLLGGILVVAGFALAKYFLHTGIPEWLVLVLVGIGGIILLSVNGWGVASATIVSTLVLFQMLPDGGEDPMIVWQSRIDSPLKGDVYGLNEFSLNDERAPDEFEISVLKVVSFNAETVSFNRSTKLYTLEGMNSRIQDDTIYKVSMFPDTVSYSKAQLTELLNNHVLGGVFREN